MKIIIRQAEKLKEVMQKAQDKAPELMEHFIKLMIFPYSRNCNHWKQEVASFIHSAPKLKSSKKFPRYKDLMEVLYYGWEDATDNWISELQIDYPNENVLPVKYEIVHECMFEYFHWLCTKLSTNGFVANQYIYNKLDELQQKCIDSCM